VARTVLLATDGSPGALKAARWLGQHLDPAQHRIHLVTVLEPPATGFGAFTGEVVVLPAVDKEAEQRRILELTRHELTGFSVTETAREGDPVREILAVVRETRPVLLVVGHRGLRGLEGLIMGSVAKALVTYSPVPVLVVPLDTPPDT
jgi:nucleotide-binding universal stress UspA family protein